MYYYEIALFGKPNFLLSYSSPEEFSPGLLITVPLRNRQTVGIIWSISTSPKFKGQISSLGAPLVQEALLNSLDRDFFDFCARYYHTPLPQILKTAFPNKLQKEPIIATSHHTQLMDKTSPNTLDPNEQQKEFIKSVTLGQFNVHALEGVTGSGKTLCYSHLIQKSLEDYPQGNILILVPEISLVENMLLQITREQSAHIITYHSQLSADNKAKIFSSCPLAKGCIFITTRSGVFLPIDNLHLVVVDEEHDSSYKEENKAQTYHGISQFFPYNARDLAIKKASLHRCPCVLGSATLSLQTSLNVDKGLYQHRALTQRALRNPLPKIELVPCAGSTWKTPVDPRLLLQIKAELDKKQQVLIYLNQRGYIPSLFCQSCHQALVCPECSTRLVVHHNKKFAHCHHCFTKVAFSSTCNQCQEPWTYCGFGTQRLAEYLSEVFPNSPLSILDSDHITTANQMNKALEKIAQEQTGLIIGTQMVCKGHNWPNVTLSVVLVGAYKLAHCLDERAAQNIVQVAGRAGRFQSGRALMPFPLDKTIPPQTQSLLEQNYSHWLQQYQKQLGESVQKKFAKISIRTKNLQNDLVLLTNFAREYPQSIEGPTLDYPAHIGKYWQLYILIASKNRQERSHIIKEVETYCQKYHIAQANLSVDIDPLSADLL